MKFNVSSKEQDFLTVLPVEVSLHILKFLNIKDLLSCAQVSKKWNKVSSDSLLWLNKCLELQIPHVSKTELIHDPPVNSESLKQQYLNYSRLLFNWQNESVVKPIHIHVHHSNVITGLALFNHWVVSCSDDGTVAVVDMTSGQITRSINVYSGGGIWSLVALYAAGQPLVATSSTDCLIRVWNVLTGKCIRIFQGHESIARCLAVTVINNDNVQSTLIISGSRDTTIRIWDVISGRCLHVLSGHIGAVRRVRVNFDRVVSCSYDHSVRIWDLKSGNCLRILIGHTNRVYTLYLGRQVILSASLDTTIRVWSTDNGDCVHILTGHRSLTCYMAMNTEESIVVSGNADNSIRVWLIKTGECIMNLDGEGRHVSGLTSVHIVMDRFIVSSGADGTVKLWNLNTGKFIRDIVRLENAFKGAVVWRSTCTNTRLVCAAGSHNFIELTKLILFDFSVKRDYQFSDYSNL